MNLYEFCASVTKEEYRDALKATRCSKKKYNPPKHEFKVEYPLKTIRSTKKEISIKVDEFLKSYITGKRKRKSNYPSEFRRKQKKLKAEIGHCLECGSTKYLQVHHIDKDKFNNKDENLKLLCYACHKSIHAHLTLPHFIAKFG